MPLITIKSLSIQGFKSFRSKQVLTFPTDPGLYFMRGDNQLRPHFGGNGCGKSNIWDALSWVFYGKTTRGLKANAVCNWGKKFPCEVSVEFSVGDVEYKLFKSQSPNKLLLNNKVKTQEEIDTLLGVGYEEFQRILLLSQFGKFFFDLSPTEKSAIFSGVLKLEYWMDKSRNAAKLLSIDNDTLDVVKRNISTLEGKLAANKEHRKQIKADFVKHADNADLEMASLVVQGKECLVEIQKLNKAVKEFIALEKDQQIAFITWKQQNEDLRREVQQNIAEQNRLMLDISRREQTITIKRTEYNDERNAEVACPACGQAYRGKALKAHDVRVNALYVQLEAEKAGLSKVRKQSDSCRVEIGEIGLNLNRVSEKLNKTTNALNQTIFDLSKVKQGAEAEVNRQVTIESELERLGKKINPFQNQLDKIDEEILSGIQQFDQQQVMLKELETRIDALKFWMDEFKKIRLWLIDDALLELQVETDAAMSQIGLEGWRVEFAVEKENKSGTISREFSMLIWPPGRDEPVPWEAWCGGETQRLRIAGARGLMNLVAGRTGVQFNMEVWDEPTAHINEGGIHDLLSYFEDCARTSEKQIWIVDHHSLNYGGFAGTITVVRDKKGSRITV